MSFATKKEATGTLQPGGGSFDARTGKWTRVWHLPVDVPSDLSDAVERILGKTRYTASTTGKLLRYLPLADPQFPWLFAERITSIQGVGMRDPANAGAGGAGTYRREQTFDPRIEEVIHQEYGFHPWYMLTVESGPRPYIVAPDSAVTANQVGSWRDWTGALKSFFYVDEWVRFVDFSRQGQPEAISGQQGTMKFTSNDVPPLPNPDGRVFPARPRMYLPDEGLQVIWHNVPYRYITSTNSYIAGRQGERPWFGCVNQNQVTWFGMKYPAGSLLYLNYQTTPRFGAAIDNIVPSGTAAGDRYGVEKFVDVTFNFGVTWRTAPAGSIPALVGSENRNFVRAGWNLQPWLPSRRFHYAIASAAPSIPAHYSFPAELLFMDPDFVQPVDVLNEPP